MTLEVFGKIRGSSGLGNLETKLPTNTNEQPEKHYGGMKTNYILIRPDTWHMKYQFRFVGRSTNISETRVEWAKMLSGKKPPQRPILSLV